MQLDILKNDLLTIYNDVTPCCPAQFDIYQLCLKLYCDEYNKLFLRSNIIENLEDLNVLQIMKLIDRLRHFTYKAYEVESLIRSNDRQSHEKDSDSEKGLLSLVENSSQSIITGEISDLQGINEVLSKLILQHKMSIRNQMNTFIENVASKLWTEASNIRLLNDEGAVYTKEPQDILFFMHHQIDVCKNACMHAIDINRVSSVCFIQLTRYGTLQFEYLVDHWHEADTVLISTLCAYINDNDKLIDNCLNFVETLEEQMMEENDESNNDFIGREKNESFEYVENCRDDLNVMIYKYTKDVAFKIGRRIVRSVIDTYLDDGKKIFKSLYTYNWFNQEENAAEMMCDGCKDLLMDLWEWVPNKLYRSFILLGVIREIVDIYHLHILYYNVNDYNMNHTTSEANALNIFCRCRGLLQC